MILELAELPVIAGRESAFEAAFAEARPLIAVSPGFLSIALRRPVEKGDVYLLLLEWRSIADHRDGFRKSDRYPRWRELLHRFYDPIPTVRYFGEDLAC